MLRYLNRGSRNGQRWNSTIPDIPRGNWELLAVVKGGAYPLFEHLPVTKYAGQRMWILPPFSKHTWRHDPARRHCEIIVTHFVSLHPLMDLFVSRDQPSSVPISAEDIKRIESLYDKLLPEYRKPRLTSAIFFEQAMLEYCQIIINNSEKPEVVAGFDANAEKVHQALAWYKEHLSEGIKVGDVAKALNISMPHLRRIFETVMGENPKEAFQRIALENACRFMSETGLSLKEIAFKSGYNGFSQFYRAFRKHYGISPEAWRNNLHYASGLGIKAAATPKLR